MVGVSKGEHIIPRALKATKTITCVCRKCNNETLSQLDEELVSRSAMSLVLLRHEPKALERSWDVDYEAGGLLLEANPSPTLAAWTLWPQLILYENDKYELRCDDEGDLKALGRDKCTALFLEAVCKAYEAYKQTNSKKRKSLRFEKVRIVPKYLRLPPRVYVRHRIEDINKSTTVRCRYGNDDDRQRIEKFLKKLTPQTRFSKSSVVIGSKRAQFCISGDAMCVIRALTKCGINLLAHVCTRTRIREALSSSIRFVMTGATCLRPEHLIARNGFAQQSTLTELECPQKTHIFRLVYYKASRLWTMYCAFFGGDLKARVEFLGESNESWSACDIIVPLKSQNWQVTPRYYEVPEWHPRIEWCDYSTLIPGMPPMLDVATSMRIVRQPRGASSKRR